MHYARSYQMLFDDVAFGIAVRDARNRREWTQRDLAERVGFKDGAAISAIECARKTDSISVRRYMTICNVLDLHPMHFWDIDPSHEGRELSDGDV